MADAQPANQVGRAVYFGKKGSVSVEQNCVHRSISHVVGYTVLILIAYSFKTLLKLFE
jgi:hypothetical protein